MFKKQRFTASALIFFILLSAMLPVFNTPSYARALATQVDRVVVGNDQDIYEGDDFTLIVYLDGTAQKLSLVDTTNFRPLDGATSWKNTDGSTVWILRLTSQGRENELKLRVSPTLSDANKDFVESVTVPNFKKSTDASTPADTFRIKKTSPRALIAGTETTLEIPVEVKNTTPLTNVNVKLVRDDSLFSSDGTDYETTISSISKTQPVTVTFKVKISPNAKSKNYQVKLKFTYTSKTGISYVDDTDNLYDVKVRSAQAEPSVSVVDYDLGSPRITAGEKKQLTLTLQNTGPQDANDVTIKLSGFDKDKIRLSSDVDTKHLSSISGNQKTVLVYSIAAASTAKTESCELNAEISYIDDAGNPYKTTSKVYVQIEGDDVSSVDLAVLNLKYPTEAKARGSFSITFDLKNQGKIEARSVEVGIEYPNASLVPKSTPKKVIRTFAPGQTQHFKFDFIAKEDAQSGFADVFVNIKYNIAGGKDADALSLREFAGLMVDGSQGLGRPKVIIENYNFGGENVLAGQTFDLNLDLFNTSSDEAIKNIKVSLKADDGVFAPVDMSSSFFIPRIDPQGRESKTITMKTKNDAQVKAYNIVVTFQYEDSKGNAYDAQKNPFKEEENITIPVNQPVRIETGELTLNPENYLNQPSPVSMEFYNMGKSTIYNLMVKAEGDFQVQGGNYFVGNFEPGRNEVFETQVIPTVEGASKGKIIFNYEDANGVPGQYVKEFTLNVVPMPVDPGTNPDGTNPDGSPMDPNQAKGLKAYAKWIALGVGVVAVLGGGVFVWKRKKKQAKALDEDLEDEDE